MEVSSHALALGRVDGPEAAVTTLRALTSIQPDVCVLGEILASLNPDFYHRRAWQRVCQFLVKPLIDSFFVHVSGDGLQ